MNHYPDEEFTVLLEAIVALGDVESSSVEVQFGQHLIPNLIRGFEMFIKPEWGAMDLLANAETFIHNLVRLNHPNATPPMLSVRWIDSSRLEIVYDSQRGLCALLKGIVDGVGRHYGQRLSVSEFQCMRRGSDACRFFVQKL